MLLKAATAVAHIRGGQARLQSVAADANCAGWQWRRRNGGREERGSGSSSRHHGGHGHLSEEWLLLLFWLHQRKELLLLLLLGRQHHSLARAGAQLKQVGSVEVIVPVVGNAEQHLGLGVGRHE